MKILRMLEKKEEKEKNGLNDIILKEYFIYLFIYIITS